MQAMAMPSFHVAAAQVSAAAQESDLALEPVGGGIALLGAAVQRLADNVATIACTGAHSSVPSPERPHRAHILLMTQCEREALRARKQSVDSQQQMEALLSTSEVFTLGVQRDDAAGAPYVVVLWPQGQQFRLRMKLPVRTFYMWLSEPDNIDSPLAVDAALEGLVQSLVQQEGAPNVAASCGDFGPNVLQHLAHHLLLSGQCWNSYMVAQYLCCRACDPAHDLSRMEICHAWVRLADAAYKLGGHKVAMLSYGRACSQTPSHAVKATAFCLKRMLACSAHTEWGTLCTGSEAADLQQHLPMCLQVALLAPWPPSFRAQVCTSIPEGHVASLCMSSRQRLCLLDPTARVPVFEMPRFFRWVVPFHLAGMSTPRGPGDLHQLASPHLGVRHVLTLTEESPLDAAWFAGLPNLRHTHMPVKNYEAPTSAQIDTFLRLAGADDSAPLLVHCGGGKGRAGTLLACYLVAYGFAAPAEEGWTHPCMPAGRAIAALRAIRPGSLETPQQEKAVHDFESRLWKQQRVLPESIPEPSPTAPQVSGDALNLRQADFIMLCGLPGSGKSWLREALTLRGPSLLVLSGDEIGRNACERAVGHPPSHTVTRAGASVAADGASTSSSAMHESHACGHTPTASRVRRVVLDRCSMTREDREHFLKLARTWAQHPVAVHLDFDPVLCAQRAMRRTDHPSLPQTGRVQSAIVHHQKHSTPPELDEGYKSVVRVSSFHASILAATRLAPAVPLFKFPRTAHLLNLGAATRDDLRASLEAVELPPNHQVVLTEKVDGANMGFSLAADGSIAVQNRSHHVTHESHAQFRKLDDYLSTHASGLHRVLARDEKFPERYVLFGEWLAATHSVHYSSLPSLFLAFDLYDRVTSSWMDRRGLAALMEGTGIEMVPLVATFWNVPSEEEVRALMHRKSQFTDEPAEGVYFKVEGGGVVHSRGKVVRADFIAGNEHWSRGPLRLNIVHRPPTDA